LKIVIVIFQIHSLNPRFNYNIVYITVLITEICIV
jgi:hypothetical protein